MTKASLYEDLRTVYHGCRSVPHRIRSTNARLVREHLDSPRPHKLHLACGIHELPGWLNTDREPPTRSVAFLDLTKRFPFADETFDYVFSEHGIEHISYPQAARMLRESFRVLRPGGKIRVVTPDFAFLAMLHDPGRPAVATAYLNWASEHLKEEGFDISEMHVINRFFREWGHQFIYDRHSLTSALEGAGFTGVKLCDLGQSSDPNFQSLEFETRMPAGFLQLESLILEAQKTTSS